MQLSNKRVVIVGGTSGIGRAIVKAIVSQGGSAIVTSRSQDKVKQLQAGIEQSVEGYIVDVTDETSIAIAFQSIGKFDHLITLPGEPMWYASFQDADYTHVRQAFEVKVWGQYLCVKYAAPQIQAGGSISLMGGLVIPKRDVTTLAMINGALDALCMTLAVDLAPLRVNIVRPGMVKSDLWNSFSEAEREALYKTVAESLLVQRVGTVEEVAEAYLYLINSSFTTGIGLTLDGGVT